MLHDIVLKGSTDRSVTVRIIDSTDGTPETGVVFDTSGIDLWYRREGAALTSITEATLAALTTAHTDGGFLHIANGVYRLDLPDAAFATGANYVDFGGTVTGMVVIGGRVRLVDVNIEDTVRAGLTALPNAAAEAAGGLYTRGTGAGQINQPANGMVDTNVVRNAGTAITAAAGRQEVNISHISGSAVSTTTAQLGVNVVQISGDATSADNLESYTDGTTPMPVNVTQFGGAAGTFTGGRAEVNASHWGGTAVASATVNANMTQISGDTTAADNLETAFDDTAGAVPWGGIIDQGTAQAATSTSLQLRSAAAFATSEIIGAIITITGGSAGVGQSRQITAYNGTTDTATVDAWTTTPTGTITYKISACPPALTAPVNVNVTQISGDSAAADNLEAALDGTGGVTITAGLTGNVTGNLSGSVGSVTGNVTGSVGSLATQAKADVNAEVLDVLNTDTFAEPGQGTPGATVSLVAKIGYLYKAWRNRHTQTATTYSLYNDDATTVDQKGTVADDGTTFSRTEITSGP